MDVIQHGFLEDLSGKTAVFDTSSFLLALVGINWYFVIRIIVLELYTRQGNRDIAKHGKSHTSSKSSTPSESLGGSL